MVSDVCGREVMGGYDSNGFVVVVKGVDGLNGCFFVWGGRRVVYGRM